MEASLTAFITEVKVSFVLCKIRIFWCNALSAFASVFSFPDVWWSEPCHLKDFKPTSQQWKQKQCRNHYFMDLYFFINRWQLYRTFRITKEKKKICLGFLFTVRDYWSGIRYKDPKRKVRGLLFHWALTRFESYFSRLGFCAFLEKLWKM